MGSGDEQLRADTAAGACCVEFRGDSGDQRGAIGAKPGMGSGGGAIGPRVRDDDAGRIGVYAARGERECAVHCGVPKSACRGKERNEWKGKYLYCVGDDGNRYCFSSGDGELVEKRAIADHELLGMVHYPNRNAMLVYSQKGEIASWRI